jgi:diacylglycerol kinase (ATP)
MSSPLTDSKKFSLVERATSFTHAIRGLAVFIKSTHNAWVHLVIFGLVIIIGFHFNITYLEWILLIFAAGLVLTAEAFNTAIEIDIDLTSPEFHPYAKDTKDVAAGAVFIAAVTASAIGILIFGRYFV